MRRQRLYGGADIQAQRAHGSTGTEAGMDPVIRKADQNDCRGYGWQPVDPSAGPVAPQSHCRLRLCASVPKRACRTVCLRPAPSWRHSRGPGFARHAWVRRSFRASWPRRRPRSRLLRSAWKREPATRPARRGARFASVAGRCGGRLIADRARHAGLGTGRVVRAGAGVRAALRGARSRTGRLID